MRILRALALYLSIAATPVAIAAPSDDNAAPANSIFEAAMSRGDVLLAGGDNEGAEREYRAALQQAPEGEARADALHKLGIALAHQSRYDDATPPIEEAEKLARTRGGSVLLADVLRAKALILYRTGRIDAARAAFREAKAILEANANAWKTGADGATWHHTPSDWQFDDAYGPLKRIRRTMLDETGHNVVVHYRIGPGGWAATLVSVYVSVDRGVPLAGEFDATRHEIIRNYPDAKPLRNGPKTFGSLKGFETVMDLPPSDNGKIRRTSLSAFARGNVLIRFRASYPAAEAATRAEQVENLIRAVLLR